MSRKEIGSLKQQLADSLGDMAKDYWSALQDYLSMNISKQQFDTTILTLFTTPQQAKLHNKLIFIIISNTALLAPLPLENDIDFSASYARKRKQTDCILGDQLKKRFNTKAILSLNAADRQRIHQLQQEIPEPIMEQHDWKNIDLIPKNCLEEGDLPTQDQLRSRVKLICQLNGLDSTFSNDVLLLLDQALQNYLKGIISNSLQKAIVHPREQPRLSTAELLFSIQMNPHRINSDLIESLF